MLSPAAFSRANRLAGHLGLRSVSRVPSLPKIPVAHRVSSSLCGGVRGLSTSSSDPVLLDVKSGVATLTFNRPDALNAMTIPMGELFEDLVFQLGKREDVHAVVLTGSGRAFSAGGDLEYLLERPNVKPFVNTTMMKRFYDRFLSIRTLPVPIIAALNGPAIGAGLCIALACDIRVASTDAKLGLTFASLGLHPGMGASFFLPTIVNPDIATRMLVTGPSSSLVSRCAYC